MTADSSSVKATATDKTVSETKKPAVQKEAEPEKGYVYILHCKDDTLYTGWTNDLQHRLAMHQSGKGAKYTRGRGPLVLVYSEELPGKSEALKREAAIKRLSRDEKLALCKAWQEKQK